jgi:hypothetical protein
MEDKPRFAATFMNALNIPVIKWDGEAMIAISRAILRNNYSETEYANEFFSIFILIDEETGHIILQGFGEYNFPSERHNLSKNLIANSLAALSRGSSATQPVSNSKLFQDDIESIARVYREQFSASLAEFKSYFRLN